ncbi:MAG: DUF3467 domain-containing protein [Deltaproteobacteria bacterium]|nr:DUF3467 domain-containing protein [Deltaproteobacteria bacterium]
MDDKPKDGGTPPQGAQPARLNIRVADDKASGRYANLAIIHNNEAEFVFDFIFVEPQRPTGQVVSRVVTNPKTVKRLLTGLGELVRRYEERFGTIPVPEPGAPQGTYH